MTANSTCGAGRRNQRVRARKCGLIQRGLLAGGIAFTSLLAGPALADTALAHIEWVNHPSIIVESDLDSYTKVKASSHSIDGKIKVRVDAEVSGRVKNWFAWPRLAIAKEHVLGTPKHDFKDNGKSKSYSTPRPKEVNESFNFTIPRQEYEDYLVVACNLHADRLRGQGKKNSEIFAQNRIIKVHISSPIEAELTGPDRLNPPPVEVTELESFDVVCERDDSLDGPAESEIAGAYMTVKTVRVSTAGGPCELEISGSIISREPDTQVKFVYVDDKGKKSDIKSVTTTNEAAITFKHRYPAGTDQKSGRIRMVGQSHAFFSNWWDYEVDCPAAPQDVKTVLPPKATHLEAIATAENVMHRGLICPAKVKIWGIIEGRGEVTGNVALAAGGKLKALEPYSIKDGQTVVVQGEHELEWDNLQSAQQNVQYAMYVLNKNGDQVDQMQATHNFVCQKVSVNPAVAGGPGGIATEQDNPLPAQQQRPQAATGQLAVAPALAVVAPRGTVRSGNIRLSGANPNAVYKLIFLRRSGGGYTAVNAAQLPKQMKGPNASFPLAALTGGRAWRLQVCPAGAAPSACETADFRVALVGAKTQSQPGGSQPTTTFIVVPGLAN